MRSFVRAIAVFLLSVAVSVGPAQAQVSSQPGLGFALVGIAEGQSLRVNALNAGSIASSAASSCEVTLRFLDIKGAALRETVVKLTPGHGAGLDLNRAQASDQPGRVQVRAILLFGHTWGGAARGPEAREQFDCNIVPSLELFDAATGRTTLVLTDAKPLPLPDQRSVAGLRGQTSK